MDHFAKIINVFYSWTVFAKRSILDDSQAFDYAPDPVQNFSSNFRTF